MKTFIDEYQIDAINRLKNGSILCGGMGSGKSRTALGYYFCKICGGEIIGEYSPMKNPIDLYIITTARKRDTSEWEKELIPFLMYGENNLYDIKIVIDSWNNIKKYADVKNSFFIFDEQRVVGYGTWSRTFIKIAKSNKWILLSATPGDKWEDYMSVFIANGFYKNKREFELTHIIYNYRLKFPKVDRYINEKLLAKHRNDILVNMDYNKPNEQYHINITVPYDKERFKKILSKRWNDETDKPIKNVSELCYLLRKVSNINDERFQKVLEIADATPKVIIFYNFDYELEKLKKLNYIKGTKVAEWNGHAHEPIPTSDRWIYLVQYSAGSDGWNCTETNTIIFFSQNYSYKTMTQASGRIDRRNNVYHDLYYYHLKSSSQIDIAISRCLNNKKNFNERAFSEKSLSQKKQML